MLSFLEERGVNEELADFIPLLVNFKVCHFALPTIVRFFLFILQCHIVLYLFILQCHIVNILIITHIVY